jgi:hypothetical protein
MPEVIIVALLVLTAIPAILWWQTVNRPEWEETAGRVVSAHVRFVRDSGRPTENRVQLSYEYQVGGRVYTGAFQGPWPETNSPNALPEERLEDLEQEGHTLTVLYNPAHPQRSQLHFPGTGTRLFYLVLTGLTGGVTLLYSVKIYPAWRRY